jgi:MFS family permease
LTPTADRLTANWDFLRVWIGQIASALGNGVSLIGTPLLVLALTNSPLQAGVVAAARSAPYLLLGLPAGALVDRWNRRTVLVCCELARGAAVASVPLAWSLGALTLYQLVGVALVQGVAVTFSNIAQVAALPRLVRRDQIAAAQALNTSSLGVAALIGPGLGGVIVGLGATTADGATRAYLLDAVTALISVTMLWTIRRPFQGERLPSERRLGGEIVEGLRYLRDDRPIFLLAIVNMVHRVCLGPVVVLAVIVFGRDVLHAPPSQLGFVVGAAGAGALLGSIVTPRLQRRVSVGWLIVAVVAIHGVGIGLVGLAPSLPAAMVGMAVVGVGEAMTSIVQVSYRLVTIPDILQGRVNSVCRLGSFGAQTVGTPVAGLLVENLGARAALWVMAAYVVTIAVGVARSDVRRI